MKHLVIVCSPGGLGSAEVNYRAALSALGAFDLVSISPGGFSSVFTQAYHKEVASKVLLPVIRSQFKSVLLITFSAGYGFPREWFKQDGIDSVDTYLAVDSIHGTHKLDNVGQFVEFAKKRKLFLEHTDVEPYSYASTTDVANHIRAAVGDRVVIRHDAGQGISMKQQHIKALTVDGPDFLRTDVVPYLLMTYGKGVEDMPVWKDPKLSLGQRCIEFCKAELESGVRGKPLGSHRHPRIQEYFSGAIRLTPGPWFGKHLPGYDTANWCAVSQGFAESQSRLPDESEVLPWTYSGLELERAAKSNGTWTGLAEVLVANGALNPGVGDVVILHRGPPNGWTRHVARVTEVNNKHFYTIGGNEGDEWKVTQRSYKHPVLGFIGYPRKEESEGEGGSVDVPEDVEEDLNEDVNKEDGKEEKEDPNADLVDAFHDACVAFQEATDELNRASGLLEKILTKLED